MDVEIKEVKKLIKERAGVKYVERTMRRENVERARARERERERARARARESERAREGVWERRLHAICTRAHELRYASESKETCIRVKETWYNGERDLNLAYLTWVCLDAASVC
jgi:hypothetical protein